MIATPLTVLWDILFGTFHNPATFDGECGFTAHREAKLGDMLLFRDVHYELGNDAARRGAHE